MTDDTVFLNPGVERIDGHHGRAIDAAMRNVLGDTYGRAAGEHRIAKRNLVIGPGELVVPPGGWQLSSVRNLDIELNHTSIVGYGDMPAVLAIDGSSYGRLHGTGRIVGMRAAGGRRADVPRDVVQILKSIESHAAPQQSHFRFNGIIEGVWREAGFRAGTVGWTQAQEDHHKSDELIVLGTGFDVTKDDAADLCKVGVVVGNKAWSNNRRSTLGYVHVAACETAFRPQQTGATVSYLAADGCRDVISFGGAVTKVTIEKGEAEYCQRLINDTAWNAHDQTLAVSHFYAKLDLWRPGLPGLEERLRENACGVWGTRGGLLLEDVTIGSLPVLRGPNGRLYFAPLRADGTREITKIAAPRFWSTQPLANIYTRHCAAHGYRAEGANNDFFAFEPQGSGVCRHEFWKNAEPDGVVTGTVMTSITQRHQP